MSNFYNRIILCFLSLILYAHIINGQVVFNEISHTNVSITNNELGLADDWVELYNTGTTVINLKNYSIHKESPKGNIKWTFPYVVIYPETYLIVLCSGKDTAIGDYFFHANFKVSKSDIRLVLSDASGKVIDRLDLNPLYEDHSYGRRPDGGNEWCYFDKPTFKSTNDTSNCYKGYESAPAFVTQSGFYSYGQTVSIKNSSESGIVRYTLDGNLPTLNSNEYSAPVPLTKTTVVSIRTFSTKNFLPSREVKGTFFINEKTQLPVFSISTDSLNLWDEQTGMYVMGPNADPVFPHYGANYWQDIEKPCYIEYYDRNQVKQFEANAGLKIFGNYSRNFPQKSFKVKLRTRYGTSRIKYPIIKEKAFIKEYKNIILRNGGSDYIETHFRDAFMQRLMSRHHTDYMGYEPAIVYLNGKYWGFYEVREKQDESYISANYGLPPEKINFIEHTGYLTTKSGSTKEFYKMYDYITKADKQSPDYLVQVNKMLDVENFVDYFVAETYYGNKDWIGDWVNNIRLWKPTDHGRWRYILWDLDWGLGLFHNPTNNYLNIARNPGWPNEHTNILNSLLENTEFRNYFINRYADLINTTFDQQNMQQELYKMRDEIAPTMQKHYETWGGTIADWHKSLDKVLNYNKQRINIARDQVQSEFGLSGQVNVELDVYPKGAGKIKISTVTPAELPWKGVYYNGVPVQITALPNHGYSFKSWETNKHIAVADQKNSITMNISSDDKFIATFESRNYTFEVYPNPTDNIVNVVYDLPEESQVTIKVISVLGEELIDILSSSYQPGGRHELKLDLESFGLTKGVYFLKIENKFLSNTLKLTKRL